MIYYTGIGSRNTPIEVQELFTRIAMYSASLGHTLRSGGASGADKSFEIGCDMNNGKKEIYLPWEGFNYSRSELVVVNPKAFELAEYYHPYWHNLSEGARKLHARNTHQVLGLDLNTPSEFIICWTPNGDRSGGTGQALRIAEDYNIPIYDVGKYSSIKEFKENLLLKAYNGSYK